MICMVRFGVGSSSRPFFFSFAAKYLSFYFGIGCNWSWNRCLTGRSFSYDCPYIR